MSTRALVLSLQGHASSRLRIGQYLPTLRAEGMSIETLSIASPRMTRRELTHVAFALRTTDVVFVQRIASMPLNALLRAASVRVVYDVDDALHYVRRDQLAAARRPSTLRERALVRYRDAARGGRYYGSRKNALQQITASADVVIVGNEFLRDELASGARDVVVLPTCVPVPDQPPKVTHQTSPVRIGWIGTADNLPELDLIEPALLELTQRFGDDVLLSIVCSRPYQTIAMNSEFTQWGLETESDSVLRFDIGIMPLGDGPYARGKCAFKAVQCMSHGVPVVVSPVGMNGTLVRDGNTGLLARSTADWVDRLSRLIDDDKLRTRLGRAGFEEIRRAYSTERGLDVVRSALTG